MSSDVYGFYQSPQELEKPSKGLLGNKGEGLFEMANVGIPIPPGFTITTEICRYFQEHGRFKQGFVEQVTKALLGVEGGHSTGARFGDIHNPLLLSVKSGASVSMPGMMDTVLNLGLNNHTVKGLILQTKDERFAYDSCVDSSRRIARWSLAFMEQKDREIRLIYC